MRIRKEELVITIDSEPYSGAEEIAGALSKLLNIPCYDQEILHEASRLSGISVSLFRRYEGRTVHAAYDFLAEDESGIALPRSGNFVAAQAAACQELAKAGPCILLNHHGDLALADAPGHVGIFIGAGFDRRVLRCAGEKKLHLIQAVRLMKKEDRQSRRYYRAYAKHWGRAENYDLTVDAAAADAQSVAHAIANYLETLTREALIHPTQALKHGA